MQRLTCPVGRLALGRAARGQAQRPRRQDQRSRRAARRPGGARGGAPHPGRAVRAAFKDAGGRFWARVRAGERELQGADVHLRKAPHCLKSAVHVLAQQVPADMMFSADAVRSSAMCDKVRDADRCLSHMVCCDQRPAAGCALQAGRPPGSRASQIQRKLCLHRHHPARIRTWAKACRAAVEAVIAVCSAAACPKDSQNCKLAILHCTITSFLMCGKGDKPSRCASQNE